MKTRLLDQQLCIEILKEIAYRNGIRFSSLGIRSFIVPNSFKLKKKMVKNKINLKKMKKRSGRSYTKRQVISSGQRGSGGIGQYIAHCSTVNVLSRLVRRPDQYQKKYHAEKRGKKYTQIESKKEKSEAQQKKGETYELGTRIRESDQQYTSCIYIYIYNI